MPTAPTAPDPPPRPRSLRPLGVAAGLVVLAALLGAGALVGPYVKDDLRLDRIVRAVALDWRDFGRDRAVERLQYELDHQGIGLQVRDEDCALTEEPEGRTVRCAWDVVVRVPWLDATFPLSFASVAILGPDGSLR